MRYSILVLFMLTGAAHASYESDAEDAKVEMGQAFYKMAILTQSFTEQGKSQGEALSYEFANKITSKMDDFIGQGVNAGASCTDVAQKMDDTLITSFSNHMRDESTKVTPKVSPVVMEKFLASFRKASLKYTDSRCEYLNE